MYQFIYVSGVPRFFACVRVSYDSACVSLSLSLSLSLSRLALPLSL